MKRPTIADIARRAGVSKVAVSYALNGQRGVSARTRANIQAIADEIGWRPNSAARALNGARARTIGLALCRPARVLGVEPFFMELISGIENTLAAQSYALMLQVVVDHHQEMAVYNRWWGEGRVDGAFLVDLHVDDPRVAELEAMRMPVVVIGHPDSAGSLSSVWSKDDDAVQETWIRFNRADTSDVDNLGAWLTTVVSRVALNMLQARRSRPQPTEDVGDPVADAAEVDPEQQALLADTVGLALLVVLDTLTPAERVAFVLHDVFAIPFDQIAPIVDRSPPATRQLASRARARVQRRDAAGEADRLRQAELVEAFLAAARGGDFEALLSVLDPEVVLRADEQSVSLGAAAETRGREPVAAFSRLARGATRALLDGAPAAVWIVDGRPKVVYAFTTSDEHITGIELIADPERIERLDLVIAD